MNDWKDKLKGLQGDQTTPPLDTKRKTGTIKFFNAKNGYGFISTGADEFYFRISNSKGVNPTGLGEQTAVIFELVEGKKGKEAVNVLLFGQSAPAPAPRSNAAENVSRQPSGSKLPSYFLPKDTLEALQSLLRSRHIDNFSLHLNKCAYYSEKEQKKGDDKGKFIFAVQSQEKNKSPELLPKFDFDPNFLAAINARHAETIRNLKLYGTEHGIPLKVNWRLIVGLDNESVYETSMTLHHIYGIPYIPGQAVKGVTRSWVITEVFGKNDNDELDLKNAEHRAIKDKGFQQIFGDQKQQGRIHFFDAFPQQLSAKNISLDIINPHYPDYYQGTKPPADYQNPIPINFLTVKEGTFDFYIGSKSDEPLQEGSLKAKTDYVGEKTIFNTAQYWLNNALTQHGLGAKTAVGYGYFS